MPDLKAKTKEITNRLRAAYDSQTKIKATAVVNEAIQYALGNRKQSATLSLEILDSLEELYRNVSKGGQHPEPDNRLLIAALQLVRCTDTSNEKAAYARCVEFGADPQLLTSIDDDFHRLEMVFDQMIDEFQSWKSSDR